MCCSKACLTVTSSRLPMGVATKYTIPGSATCLPTTRNSGGSSFTPPRLPPPPPRPALKLLTLLLSIVALALVLVDLAMMLEPHQVDSPASTMQQGERECRCIRLSVLFGFTVALLCTPNTTPTAPPRILCSPGELGPKLGPCRILNGDIVDAARS